MFPTRLLPGTGALLVGRELGGRNRLEALVGAGLLLTVPIARSLNLLARGELLAGSLGVEVRTLRRYIYLVASLLTAGAVTAAGSVGFVGLVVPHMLSFLVSRKWNAPVEGLSAFPESQWPDNIPLLYYSYHIMVGLGTIFIAIMTVAAWLLWKQTLFDARWMLWILMLSFPFPYIANTAGWITAEIGRQPWVVHGLMRTEQGFSFNVVAGNALFTLIGFMGMYTLLSMLFLLLMWREIEHGPEFLSAGAR